MVLLEVDNLNSFYGKSQVVYNVNLKVCSGEIVSIVGRNGVGKTTILKSIMSLVDKRDSRVVFKGRDITHMPAYRISKLGIGFIPDNGGVFLDLTVEENFRLALRKGANYEEVFELFPEVKALLKRKGAYLSGGERRLVGILRALLINPDLLIVDEPSEGLAPSIVREIEKLFKQLRERGFSILFADQNVNFIMNVFDRLYIVDNGQVKFEGRRGDVTKELLEKYISI